MTNSQANPAQAIGPTIDDHYDVVIVGARAAGAATAMLLAREGLRVLAIDKAAYGSDTLSSHALMRGAISSLGRWGLLDEVYGAGTPIISKTVFTYGIEELAIDIPPTPDVPGLAAPRRTVLDPILVDAALASGATVLHETRLVGIDTDDTGCVVGVQIEVPGGPVKAVATDLLIGADGLRSAVARQLDVPITRMGSSASAYIMRYFSDLEVDRNAYAWLYKPGIGAGVIPTNDGVCVFAAMTQDEFRSGARKNTEAAMVNVLNRLDPELAASVMRATPQGPIRSWPGVRGQFRKPFGPGWALVGDAGYFKDPFAAHGISDAFRDAELLAQAVRTGDYARYEQRRDELSAPLFDVLEKIAGYDWDLETLPGLHFQLSKAMRAEGKAFAEDLEASALQTA